MHITNSKTPGFLQKIVGGGIEKLLRLCIVAILATVVPYSAAFADKVSAINKLFTTSSTISASPYNNNSSDSGGISSGWVGSDDSIETASSGSNGAGYGRWFYVVTNINYNEASDEITGLEVCSVKIKATVNHKCDSNVSGTCGGKEYRKVGHLSHEKSNCIWVCAKGWTGAKDGKYCTHHFNDNNTEDLNTVYGYVGTLSWNMSSTADPFVNGNTYQNYDRDEEGDTTYYNILKQRYLLGISYDTASKNGVWIKPAIINTYITNYNYYIDQISVKPRYVLEGNAVLFCLPGYVPKTENNVTTCTEIPEPTPCKGLTAPSVTGSGDWKNVVGQSKCRSGCQTKGTKACVCTSTTDMNTCGYKIITVPESVADCVAVSRGFCKFTLAGTTAYADLRPEPFATDTIFTPERRCKPGYYGEFMFKNENGNLNIDGNCTDCTQPDYFEGNADLSPGVDWEWADKGIPFGEEKDLCAVKERTEAYSNLNEEQCDKNAMTVWFNGKCYARIKDKDGNTFILPEADKETEHSGICEY